MGRGVVGELLRDLDTNHSEFRLAMTAIANSEIPTDALAGA
jgi:hypothetical protein